jgi:hypothetical protein
MYYLSMDDKNLVNADNLRIKKVSVNGHNKYIIIANKDIEVARYDKLKDAKYSLKMASESTNDRYEF